MIDHFSIPCADLAVSASFYDRVLGVLGHRRLIDVGVAMGYGTDHPVFWLAAVPASGPNRESHIAFSASTRELVDGFHAAALEHGAEELHAPRVWPEYHPTYYGAFVRDPDGNNVEAVCHAPPG